MARPQRCVAEPQKWEYLIEPGHVTLSEGGVVPGIDYSKLNGLGEKGWELVAVAFEGYEPWWLYFKRPKQ